MGCHTASLTVLQPLKTTAVMLIAVRGKPAKSLGTCREGVTAAVSDHSLFVVTKTIVSFLRRTIGG